MDEQWKRIEALAANLGGTATRVDDKWCKVITPGLILPMNRYDSAERQLQDEFTTRSSIDISTTTTCTQCRPHPGRRLAWYAVVLALAE